MITIVMEIDFMKYWHVIVIDIEFSIPLNLNEFIVIIQRFLSPTARYRHLSFYAICLVHMPIQSIFDPRSCYSLLLSFDKRHTSLDTQFYVKAA